MTILSKNQNNPKKSHRKASGSQASSEHAGHSAKVKKAVPSSSSSSSERVHHVAAASSSSAVSSSQLPAHLEEPVNSDDERGPGFKDEEVIYGFQANYSNFFSWRRRSPIP
jgi:hypothetical protein